MIYFTSDLHFCHDRDFLYKPRGFNSIEEHDKKIIENWNSKVQPEDEVYILGDLMLNDNEKGLYNLRKLNGKLHIILGNHDSQLRREVYACLTNVIDICEAKTIKINKQYYFLCHYPTITANYDDKPYHNHLINLSGHTHFKEKFYDNNPFIYNVALDAHNNYPVSIEEINEDIHNKVQELYQNKIKIENYINHIPRID